MARWKLTEPHYLRTNDTKWEYTEVDRITGRPKRTQFDVPRHLDPNAETDWTHRIDQWSGDIIVSDGHNADPKDIIFVGDPTPGMLPLDDEAREISGRFKDKWMPTPGLDIESQAASYQAKLLNGMIEQMSELQAGVTKAPQVEGIADLMKAMTMMMQQNQAILEKLVEKAAPERRKVA